MLTPRGWWFFLVALLTCAFGAGFSDLIGSSVALLGLTILAWFLWEWLVFLRGHSQTVPALRVERQLSDKGQPMPVLWTDGEYDVRVSVSIASGRLPYIALSDWIPQDARYVHGRDETIADLCSASPVRLNYRIACPTAGELIFEGVRVRISDSQGFFYHRTIVKDGSRVLVLPRLTGAEANRRGQKRHNIFPPPGVHRLKRPGGGSELLDLRDYLPGDPPKMIAWKPSARKDKLYTKEFESEVPIRCTMFVDASESTRLGVRRRKLTRLVNLAAGVAEAAIADRDHAGLVIFDEHETQVMRPKRSRRHVIDMLRLMSRAAARPTPIGPFADANALARLSFPLASELYPDLLHRRANSTPWRMFWAPVSDYRRFWWAAALAGPFAIVFCNYLARQVGFAMNLPPLVRTSWSISRFFYGLFGAIEFNLAGMPIQILRIWPVTMALALIGGLIWLLHGLSGQWEPWRSERLRRKKLGLVFATLDGSPPGTETHYLHDDQVFARRAQAFLAQHHALYPVRMYDARGRFLFRGESKLDVLVKALNHAVARGRDNELFVLLADLVELTDDMEHLLRAVRVAVARHHEVIVVLPWPTDIPDPPHEPPDDSRIPTRRAERYAVGGYRSIAEEVDRTLVERYHRAYFKARRAFGRLHVTVVRSNDQETVQVILDRIDRLRGVGRRR